MQFIFESKIKKIYNLKLQKILITQAKLHVFIVLLAILLH